MVSIRNTVFISLIGLFFGLVIVEHVCRVNQFTYAPSQLISDVTVPVRRFFETVGQYFAWVSSFFIRLHLEEFVYSFQNVCNSLFNFCTSPFYSIYGYLVESLSYTSPVVIYTGSGVLVVMTCCLVLYLFFGSVSNGFTTLVTKYPYIPMFLGGFVLAGICYTIWNFYPLISQTELGQFLGGLKLGNNRASFNK